MALLLSSPINSQLSPVKSALRMSRFSSVETAESPYKARVQSIGKRLSEIQSNLEVSQYVTKQQSSPTLKTEQAEAKIKNIDGKITENHSYVEDKLRLCSNEILKLEEQFSEEISALELLNEACTKDVVQLEDNLAVTLQIEQQRNKDSSRRTLGNIDNKINHLRDDFALECRKIDAVKNEQSQKLGEQISHLKQSIRDEAINREEAQENIIKKFSNRLSATKDLIKREQKVRVETEKFLFEKIEQINNSLFNQAKNEREQRESTEAQMLILLEEACARYEDQVRTYRR